MNYRHIYHAGNACDVVKHAVLTLLIEHLREKEKGFAVLDTHAGAGLYDLSDERAQKTKEAEEGILRLLSALPIPELAAYYRTMRELNKQQNFLPLKGRDREGGEWLGADSDNSEFCPSGTPPPLTPPSRGGELNRFYPGSPVLIRRLMRSQDRLMACELHPKDVHVLKRYFHDDKQTQIHHRDGYEALKALIPPTEKRGLVLIDPPFEKPDEFDVLAEALRKLHERWQQGQAVVWYPIKERPAIWRFHEALAAMKLPRVLCAEFTQYPEIRHDRLNGCGLILVNPPWRLDDQLKQLFPALHEALESAESGTKINWLAVEDPSR